MEQDKRRQFLSNSRINPRTGRPIEFAGPTYTKLVKEFGVPPADEVQYKALYQPKIIMSQKPTGVSSKSISVVSKPAIVIPTVSRPVISPKPIPVVSKSALMKPTVTKPISAKYTEWPKDKLGLTGIEELDMEIILNLDLNSIINLMMVDQSTKKLIRKILPQIINKYYNADDNDPLYSFASDLLTYGEIDLLKQFLKYFIRSDDDTYIYDSLAIVADNENMLSAVFALAPKDHDWSSYTEIVEDNLGESDWEEDDEIKYMMRILKAAIKTKQQKIINFIIVDLWDNIREDAPNTQLVRDMDALVETAKLT